MLSDGVVRCENPVADFNSKMNMLMGLNMLTISYHVMRTRTRNKREEQSFPRQHERPLTYHAAAAG